MDEINSIEEAKSLLVELSSNLSVLMQENDAFRELLHKDDVTASLHAQVLQLSKEVYSLRERNAGLMEEKNSAIRAAKRAVKTKRDV